MPRGEGRGCGRVRVTYVIDNLALGGAQKHLCQLVVGLARRGHRQRVVCLNEVHEPAYVARFAEAGVEVCFIGRAAMRGLVGFWRLRRMLARDRSDVVVSLLFFSTVASRLAARGTGVQKGVTCVQARNTNFAWWQFWALRMTARWSDAFVFNARAAMGFAAEHEGARREASHFIANGIEVAASAGAGRARGARAAAGMPFADEDFLIGAIGRLDPQKGFDVLLRALVQVEGAKLVVIGEGAEAARLKQLADELAVTGRVCFLGARTDAAALLPLCDAYAQPSRFEGTPNAVMEAMAAGVPVVASAVDGVAEIVTPKRTGWLVPTEHASALAEALRVVMREPERAKAIAAAARVEITERFSVEAMVDAYERLLADLAAG